ncbi:hypothetical protein L1049_005417 [Liquidambar formosana]|uniref:DDE Tnp4 domain-containing protein n=1 Tax=Liquidambar formosana TaxID=63359 RepID=A0AAP0RQI6_LIQFO
MLMLTMDMIKTPNNFDDIPSHIRQNPNYLPYFKDCIGTVDSTHVRTSLLSEEQISYISKKNYPTQNIMSTCGFDMCFTFVWPG